MLSFVGWATSDRSPWGVNATGVKIGREMDVCVVEGTLPTQLRGGAQRVREGEKRCVCVCVCVFASKE